MCKGVSATLCKFVAGEQANGEARTSNIQPMFVTLDVSKPSGWLNARAYCAKRVASGVRCHGASCAARRAIYSGGGRP